MKELKSLIHGIAERYGAKKHFKDCYVLDSSGEELKSGVLVSFRKMASSDVEVTLSEVVFWPELEKICLEVWGIKYRPGRMISFSKSFPSNPTHIFNLNSNASWNTKRLSDDIGNCIDGAIEIGNSKKDVLSLLRDEYNRNELVHPEKLVVAEFLINASSAAVETFRMVDDKWKSYDAGKEDFCDFFAIFSKKYLTAN